MYRLDDKNDKPASSSVVFHKYESAFIIAN